jgi:hypothetical protein
MCALDVGAVRELGVLDRLQDGRHGGQVDDAVETALERRLDHLSVSDIALDDLHLGIRVGLKVDDPHVSARLAQSGHDMAADETRSARD